MTSKETALKVAEHNLSQIKLMMYQRIVLKVGLSMYSTTQKIRGIG
jgi:hypothetical protein